MSNEEAERCKNKGNEFLKERKFEEAIKEYNKAITVDSSNAIYYSNRSAAWAELKKWPNSLNDAIKCIEKDSRFVKGYSRKGTALLHMGRKAEARQAFQDGLVIDPTNVACKQGIQSASSVPSGPGMMKKAMNMWEQLKKSFASNSRVQMYVTLAIIYMAWQFYNGSRQTATATKPAVEGMRQYAFVQVPSGRQRISFTTRGSGPGVLLLHQPGLSYETELIPLMEKLGSENMHVLAVDLPCHGESDCDAENISMESILTELKPVWDHPTYSVVTSGASSRYIRELKAGRAVFSNPDLPYPSKSSKSTKPLQRLREFVKRDDDEQDEDNASMELIRDATKYFLSPRSKYEKDDLPPKYLLDHTDFPHLWLSDRDVGATEHRTYMSVNGGKMCLLSEETQENIVDYLRPSRSDERVAHDVE